MSTCQQAHFSECIVHIQHAPVSAQHRRNLHTIQNPIRLFPRIGLPASSNSPPKRNTPLQSNLTQQSLPTATHRITRPVLDSPPYRPGASPRRRSSPNSTGWKMTQTYPFRHQSCTHMSALTSRRNSSHSYPGSSCRRTAPCM